MNEIILDSLGLEPSAKARRYSEQSCRGRHETDGFFSVKLRTPQTTCNTQMEIGSPKCLLNSKECILNKNLRIESEMYIDLFTWYHYHVFCFSLCSSEDWLLWILPALCWPSISGKRKHSIFTGLYIILWSYHQYSKWFWGEKSLCFRERVDAILFWSYHRIIPMKNFIKKKLWRILASSKKKPKGPRKAKTKVSRLTEKKGALLIPHVNRWVFEWTCITPFKRYMQQANEAGVI